MENAVSVGLRHLRVDIVAGVSQFSYLLCEELDALGAVAENYALVDL